MLADKDLNVFSQRVDSQTRVEFLSQLLENGKFADAVCIYRHNSSADRIGVFDKEIIDKLPPSVKWIAHNGESNFFFLHLPYRTLSGAGYDQIDVHAAKARGEVWQ
jgi:glyoxylate reductase